MTVVEILADEDPAALMAALLLEISPADWNPHLERFEELMHFYGRIFGGGLGHAIGCASDDAIPEFLRLVRTYGSPEAQSWSKRLAGYFSDGLLSQGQSEREAWELSYIEGIPSEGFESLGKDVLPLQLALGQAICGYVRENLVSFENYTLG